MNFPPLRVNAQVRNEYILSALDYVIGPDHDKTIEVSGDCKIIRIQSHSNRYHDLERFYEYLDVNKVLGLYYLDEKKLATIQNLGGVRFWAYQDLPYYMGSCGFDVTFAENTRKSGFIAGVRRCLGLFP